MTDATASPAPTSTWSWWERRRLAYNLGLFVAGWVGFAIQLTAWGAWTRLAAEWTELVYVALSQGLVYLFYMVAANIFYLGGAVVEGLLRPEPVDTYRRYAWRLGFAAATGLPVVVAVVVSLLFTLATQG